MITVCEEMVWVELWSLCRVLRESVVMVLVMLADAEALAGITNVNLRSLNDSLV
jgi:hypothetical protein